MAMAIIKPNIINSSAVRGSVRYNEFTNYHEVYNGTEWTTITGSLSYEDKVNKLAETHPGIKDLKSKLDMMVKLATKENNGTN